MKNLTCGLVAGSLFALALVGCDEKKKADAEPSAKATSTAAATGTATAKASASATASASASATAAATAAPSGSAQADAPPLTIEQYEQLIVAMSSCAAKETESSYYGYIDSACEAYKAFNAARSKKDATKNLGDTGPLARKLLAHESPAVRIQAAGMTESLFGTSKDNQTSLLDAARKEKDVAVIKAMIHAMWNNGARNPEVGKLLLELAKHENPRVRATAGVGISSSWNKGMEGAVDKMIELMEKDPELSVRKAVCAYAGAHGDDKLVAVYDRLTGPKADPDLAAECWTGVLKMWASYPLWENRNEKAYKLTLKLLAAKPRTEKLPPWTAMGTFESLGKASGSSWDKWKADAKWYDANAILKHMLDLAGDPKAKWMARTGAVRAAGALGAKKADLEALKKKLTTTGDDKFVQGEIDKVLPTAK